MNPEKYYSTGIPCRYGHIAPRLKSTRACSECARLATRRWKDDNPLKAALSAKASAKRYWNDPKRSTTLTQARLKEMLHFDPNSGIFTWLVDRPPKVSAGQIAGTTKGTKGYRLIVIDSDTFRAHRLAWLYVTGTFPKSQIDHINGNRDDNRLTNLREATSAENRQNNGMYRSNTSGFAGVTWHVARKKWRSQIQVDGKNMGLGYFDTPDAAQLAYLEAKAKFHSFSPVPRELKKAAA